MSIFPKRNEPNRVDLDQLEHEVIGKLKSASQDIPYSDNYTPQQQPHRHLPLQIIAHAITKLTWAEAEKMGAAIYSQMKDANSVEPKLLTSAIQAWAEGWESFSE